MTQEELDNLGRERKPRNTTDRRPTMSELKAHHIIGLDGRCNRVDDDYYLKSEADKPVQHIELLKPRIMKNGCEYYLAGEVRICIEQAARQIVESNSVYKELDTIIKHQKYKRCLAMAAVCFEKSYSTTLVKYDKESGLLRNFYDWWGKRWLALAEEPTWAKFLQLIHKEAK